MLTVKLTPGGKRFRTNLKGLSEGIVQERHLEWARFFCLGDLDFTEMCVYYDLHTSYLILSVLWGKVDLCLFSLSLSLFLWDRNITRAILDVNYLDCITAQLQWPDLNANRLTLSFLSFYPLHALFPHIIYQNSQNESITVTVHMLHKSSGLQS